MNIWQRYLATRQNTVQLVKGLSPDELSAQPAPFVSPPKWHLGHTTWFFETLLLKKWHSRYPVFDKQFTTLFNSYYQSLGEPLEREKRGTLTTASLEKILRYRQRVDQAIMQCRALAPAAEFFDTLALGLEHEMQHQELLRADVKYILNQTTEKKAHKAGLPPETPSAEANWIHYPGGLVKIGHADKSFGFDNEKPRHPVYLAPFSISSQLVSNRQWLEFIKAKGYQKSEYWHAEGWDWLQSENIQAPLYWQQKNEQWWEYTLAGFKPLDEEKPVGHISYYEAAAFAQWQEARLPTEAEWETAAPNLNWGQRWEWTESAYLPYPGYKRYLGPAQEYNAKFMVNQMVLRGASAFTPADQKRPTYRNFFHAPERWQYTGLRLAKNKI
jgi:ergothioneine biosynthesis protein EgtB